MSVNASKIYDYTESNVAPVANNIAAFEETKGAAGTYYVSLKVTIDPTQANKVTGAEIEMKTTVTEPTETTIVIAVGEFVLAAAGNAVVVDSVTQHTSGAIYYPFGPPWAKYTITNNILDIGLQLEGGSLPDASKDKPALVKTLNVFCEEDINIICKSDDDNKLVIGTEVGEKCRCGCYF